uniref:Variant surface glycoprotein n=1 Tax=Trypanosoma brucei TaxID=5691 RepID=A0A1V0FYS1_9TRYP|nr:variant surface glycoprotein [Trypanosoma brucei]
MVPGSSVDGRYKSCGKEGDDNSNSRAGTILKHDIMCLCAKGHSSASGQACGENTPQLTIDGPCDAEFSEEWKKLKCHCEDATDNNPLTEAQLTAATVGEKAAIASSIGGTNKYTYFLGIVDGDSTGGCDTTNVDASKKGTCLYYGRRTGA